MLSIDELDRQVMQGDGGGSLVFETNRTDSLNTKSLFFKDPVKVLKTYNLDEVTEVLVLLDNAVKNGYYAAGFISYEAGFAFEPSLKILLQNTRFELPLIWFGLYHEPFTIDSVDNSTPSIDDNSSFSLSNLAFSLTESQYKKGIKKVKEYIGSGDTYQINLTWPVHFDFTGDAYAFYNQLKQNQPVSYAAFMKIDEFTVLSLSPELFFRRHGSQLTTKPMKGTVHRGRTLNEDRELASWLKDSEKNHAENIMIVDMLRNDMGRICKEGSIQVDEMFSVEKFRTLFQMTSTINGTLKAGTTYTDIFSNLFPCGSVTGAPKIRSMEIIHELERSQRGIYTGAIGYISPHDEAVFNVAIRTVILQDRKGRMGIGSGVVWDSDAEDEYEECTLKMRFLTQAEEPFSLIETLLCDNNNIPLLDNHMKRLEDSAEYFDFPFHRDAVFEKVMSFISTLNKKVKYKIRLMINREGVVQLGKSKLIIPENDTPKTIALSAFQTNSQDRFLYHKTTKREIYSSQYENALENGLYDIIFMNERAEITEACIHNIFIKTGDRLVTPPVSCGLLNGVQRNKILQTEPNAEERVITLADIRNADEIYLSNAVRGMIRVAFTPLILHENGTQTIL